MTPLCDPVGMAREHIASTDTALVTADATAAASAPEQLRLLDASDIPLRFRLDITTRQRGLAHVAELRRILDEQALRRHAVASGQTDGQAALGTRRRAA